ncbi:hypothetical protein FHT17_003413 [Novosphingobium sp. SG916]|nr:hypothetical protein [Novosphingobium sp. SG919]NMN88506.1 hypothetical protein [Novosphingobium sp. SG916]
MAGYERPLFALPVLTYRKYAALRVTKISHSRSTLT